jgi:hypothetical protein
MYPKDKVDSQAKAGYKMMDGSQGCEYKLQEPNPLFSLGRIL